MRNARMDFIVSMGTVLSVQLIHSILMEGVSASHLSGLIEMEIVCLSVNNYKYTIQ